MDERKLLKELDQLFGIETRKGIQSKLLPEDLAYEMLEHPSNEAVLSYLRGEMSHELRAPEDVMQGIIRGDLADWRGPEIAAHLSICERCKSEADELKGTAMAQAWWQSAYRGTLEFLERYYQDQVAKFARIIEVLGRQPQERVKGFAYFTSPSPIGAWGLGEEDAGDEKEGITVLALLSSIMEELSVQEIDSVRRAEPGAKKSIKRVMDSKSIPPILRSQLLEYLRSA